MYSDTNTLTPTPILWTTHNSFTGQEDPTVVSYLSLAHGGDRGICWQAMFAGAKIGFARTVSHTHHDSNITPSSSSSAASSTAGMDSVTMLLEDIQAIRPTFFLGMPHFWSECHVLYKKELEALVNDIVLTLFLTQETGTDGHEATTPTPLPSVLTRLLQGGDNGNDHGLGFSFRHLPPTPETSQIVLAAVRQLDEYSEFVDAIGTLYGV